ncbi:MAG: 4Fe-4S dicluster domain-containing protein [Chloroflexi bacterium]|nr:4Fe-4S dicluster domain-containing protein [Chloroflexota bacterium]
MLNTLRTSLRTGRVTSSYPDEPDIATAYRGRPEIDPERCDCTGACVEACSSGAITLVPAESGARRWQLDLARCVFCGLCAEVCPNSALEITSDFELATRSRDDLIIGVTHQAPDQLGAEMLPARGVKAPVSSAPSVTAETLGRRLSHRIWSLLRRSLHIRHLDAGSDNSSDWEIASLLNPVYDVQRLGIDFVASPRHADLLLVTGAVTRHLERALQATYEAMPSPGLVVAVGADACGGGVLQGSYAVAGGVDRCLPVDVYIPGDPPRPQALIFGLLVALNRLEPKLQHRELVTTAAQGNNRGECAGEPSGRS